jgi:hypothetical protein
MGKKWLLTVNDELVARGHLSGQATPCCDGNFVPTRFDDGVGAQ